MKNFEIYLIALFAFSLTAVSCDRDDTPDNPEAEYGEILNNVSENVILQTYGDLAERGSELQAAAQALEENPNSDNLDAARNTWIAARSPWEQSEGFLFGPVDQEGLDPAMDSWPVNVTDLDNVLNSGDELTVEFLHQQEGTLKGFHTIEYLLWGKNGDKAVEDFTDREFEYLSASTGALAEDTQSLYDLWRPDAGNYIENILSAGENSAVYVSQKSALEEITNALIIIADEVGNGKINDPFVQEDLTLEESRFSANSKRDFADNMRSIKNIYTGYYSTFGNGKSLYEIIQDEDGELHEKLNSQIDDAIEKIEAIEGTFSDAVFNDKEGVSAAQTAVRDLQESLEGEVVGIISNL